jgi:phage-related protein
MEVAITEETSEYVSFIDSFRRVGSHYNHCNPYGLESESEEWYLIFRFTVPETKTIEENNFSKRLLDREST